MKGGPLNKTDLVIGIVCIVLGTCFIFMFMACFMQDDEDDEDDGGESDDEEGKKETEVQVLAGPHATVV